MNLKFFCLLLAMCCGLTKAKQVCYAMFPSDSTKRQNCVWSFLDLGYSPDLPVAGSPNHNKEMLNLINM